MAGPDLAPVALPAKAALLIAAGLTLGFLSACGTSQVAGNPEIASQPDHYAEIMAWRERRRTGLLKPDGWLSLVGLHWLEPGVNTIGTADTNDIILSHGPTHWGTVVLADSGIQFQAAPGIDNLINGVPGDRATLAADTSGDPTIIAYGTTQFHVLERGQFALRVKDANAPERLDFKGIENFPVSSDLRIEATFEPAAPGATLAVGNVLNQLNDEALYGTAVFELDGNTYRLLAVGDQDAESLFFIFADRTNGRETYGAGRFVYTDLPSDGKLILDFNKAYNPPCVFNEFSTCPLPPPENRLAIAIRAGEKNYTPSH